MPERQRRTRHQSASPVLHGSTVSRLLALPALLLVGLTAWHIVPIGLASAWYFKANYFVELWVKNQPLLTEESWKQASEAIDKAIELHPKHPHYLLTKAKINEWGWYAGLMTTKELEQTETYYKDAIQARPLWPNAYADYAYYLGVTQFRITEAFEQLELAKKYGPYMPETSLRELALGLSRWSLLNGQQKTETFYAMDKALQSGQSSYFQSLNIIRSTGKVELACTYFRTSKNSLPEPIRQLIKDDLCAKSSRSASQSL